MFILNKIIWCIIYINLYIINLKIASLECFRSPSHFLYKFSRLKMYSSWQTITLTLIFVDHPHNPSCETLLAYKVSQVYTIKMPLLYQLSLLMSKLTRGLMTCCTSKSNLLTESLIRDEKGISVLWPCLYPPKVKIENISVIDFTHYTLFTYRDVFAHTQPKNLFE